MLLFNFLKDIIYRKQGDLLDNPENEVDFTPWLIQRWLSMYSEDSAKILNNTTNQLYPVFETKREWYKIFLSTIPKTYFKKIKYIKKIKKDKIDNINEVYKFIAQNKQMSVREVKEYIKEFNIDTKQLEKIFKKEG